MLGHGPNHCGHIAHGGRGKLQKREKRRKVFQTKKKPTRWRAKRVKEREVSRGGSLGRAGRGKNDGEKGDGDRCGVTQKRSPKRREGKTASQPPRLSKKGAGVEEGKAKPAAFATAGRDRE